MSYRCSGDNTISNKSTVPVAVYSVSAYKSNYLATLCHDSSTMQWKELCSFYPSYVSLIFSVIERKWKGNCCHVELFTKDMRILYFYGVWIILRLVLLQFCCIFHTLFALNMVLKKQQQYAALGSLDPEPHFLNSLCSWLSRTCSPFPIILQQTEMDLFLILRSRLNFFLSFFQ